MTLKEIVEKCGALAVDEKRDITDEYAELVFHTKETDEWNRIFTDVFGPAVKPGGAKPTKEDLLVTKEYGGVRRDQTLFKKESDGVILIAMFWPWGDGEHTTLKMAILQEFPKKRGR